MAEYTKGKWEIDGDKIKMFGHGIIAICPSPQDGGVFEVVNNKHLIAAAPAMYEALKKICGWLEAQAKRDEVNATTCRHLTLRDAYVADAKNYRAMAKDLGQTLALAERKEG